jgi:hypothetical protein
MILSSACCTPSPDTSRVIDGLSLLRRSCRSRRCRRCRAARARCRDRRCAAADDDVLDVLADVARLGEVGGVGDRERHVEDARQRLREQRLARAGRPEQEDVRLLQLDVVVGPVALASMRL